MAGRYPPATHSIVQTVGGQLDIFKGKIKAKAFELDAFITGSAPVVTNMIRWVNATNLLRVAYVYGSAGTFDHTAVLMSDEEATPSHFAFVQATTSKRASPASTRSTVYASASDVDGASGSRVIIDAGGNSHFMQSAQAAAAGNKLARGIVAVPMVAATKLSSAVTVNHGLGVTPAAIILTGPDNATAANFLAFVITAKTATSFTFRAYDIDATPGSAFNLNVHWLAVT